MANKTLATEGSWRSFKKEIAVVEDAFPLWLVMCLVWLSAGALTWAIFATLFCFWNPLPFPDRGHRCFAVPNENVARIVVTMLDELTGLGERFTFSAGRTCQTLLLDNTTVIIWHDASADKEKLPPNGLSVVVSDPRASAQKAADILRKAGLVASIRGDFMPEAGNKIAVLTSDAFDGWALVFRRHVLKMGPPPNKRRLIP